MKRKQFSEWEELKDPDRIPRDIEAPHKEQRLPDGSEPDENYLWRRPDKDYTAPVPSSETSSERTSAKRETVTKRQMLSSEELYKRASEAKSQRIPKNVEPKFYDSRKKRKKISRGVITGVLTVLLFVLLFAVKNQIDYREKMIKESEEQAASLAAAATNAGDETAETTAVQAAASVEIVGSWADRSGELPAQGE